MKRFPIFLFGVAASALLVCAGPSYAVQIWTDTNGDGAPDAGPLVGSESQNLTVDLWIDSQSFVYTAYNIWAEWGPGLSRVGEATNQVTGCPNDPVDTFSHPRGVGFAGSGCSPAQQGVKRIGTFALHIDSNSAGACVMPIIDPDNEHHVFSTLSGGASYLVFEIRTGSCLPSGGDDSTDTKGWGRVKGLYK